MSEWSEFLDIVKEEREKKILDLAKELFAVGAHVAIVRALAGAMTVARVFLESKNEITGGEVAACVLWPRCKDPKSKRPCPFFDTRGGDDCGIPHETEADVKAGMKVYRRLYDKMPPKYKRTPVLYV